MHTASSSSSMSRRLCSNGSSTAYRASTAAPPRSPAPSPAQGMPLPSSQQQPSGLLSQGQRPSLFTGTAPRARVGPPPRAKYMMLQSMPLGAYTPVGGEARIKVIGVGGGGNNALNRMIDSGLQVSCFCFAQTGGRMRTNFVPPPPLRLPADG